jgi:endonuclease YncB( thermonuclease family)
MTETATSFILGAVGGIASWFATDFIARPVRRFFHLREEITEEMIIYGNVRAPINEHGDVTEHFTDTDRDRLKEAQILLRRRRRGCWRFVIPNRSRVFWYVRVMTQSKPASRCSGSQIRSACTETNAICIVSEY